MLCYLFIKAQLVLVDEYMFENNWSNHLLEISLFIFAFANQHGFPIIYLGVVSEQAEMATSSDNLALEKIDLLSHAEETMDIEYEVLEVYGVWTLKLTLNGISALSYLYNIAQSTSVTDLFALIKQNEMGTEEGQLQPESVPSLPVLCIEDGSVILRFSEIFGIQEPVRKVKTDHHKRPVNKGILHVGCNKKILKVSS